ncbi:MAG TPA: UvrD-helicase domain-containing protein [Actinomycetales bacterium]|jgi:exodeoxyribonuclease V beta subunit
MTDAPRFAVLGPLPTGTTVLEASAGTGKTFTIAALVARYVAEGVATMDQLLVVSFSRESTRELRDRVRERLVRARDGLARPHDVDPRDTVLTLLATGEPAEVAVRRRRVQDALAAFDSATVTTTHGFCQQVLTSLGTAGDHDTGATLVEDVDDMVDEVADDLYLRKWGRPTSEPPSLSRSDFRELARIVVRDRATALLPGTDADGLPGMRARIAHGVRAEVERRKRRQHVIDYDDLLLRLSATMSDPVTGPVVLRRLREQYRIVLVDEFQDTDPVQWQILREPFHGHRTLVLIGDPKQAIYGFRGADVHAYLDARHVAGSVHTLDVSFRSDASLIRGLDAVFRRAALGHPEIKVVPVTARHAGRMVAVAGHPGAVRLRVLPRDGLRLTQRGVATADDARRAVVADLAAEVVELLGGGAVVSSRDTDERRDLLPGDIAVLVRTNKEAAQVSDALRAAQVPVVVTGRTSVFATEAAQEWQLLLEALEQPHRTTRVGRLALGAFVGLRADEVAGGAETEVSELALRLRQWAAVLDERGVAALFESVSMTYGLQPRLLARHGGERLLTDLRHVAQVLHEVALAEQLGLTALGGWLRRRREQDGGDGGTERSRRLDSDAAAVQVITVHTSKGLEFPVVLMPFAWNHWGGKEPATAAFHDDRGERVRDVGGAQSPDWPAHVRQQKQEETDDELRLAYVGMTRAMSHLVLWWAPTSNTPSAPLHRLLLDDGSSVVAPMVIKVPSDGAALTAFAARATADLAVEVVTPRRVGTYAGTTPTTAALSAATLGRGLDTAWRRTSYSALTAAAHDVPVRLGSEPELAQKDDETDVDEPAPAVATVTTDDDALRLVVSQWDGLPGGTGFGTLVHAALEVVDDLADDDALRTAVAVQAARSAPGTDVGALTAALRTSLATPLGPLAGGLAIQQIGRADRLPELDFELPLAGGDQPVDNRPLLSHLVPLWRKHCGDGPLVSYADALAELEPAPLRGYLNGSIDAVLRVATSTGPRYLVVDYKTNRLGGYDEPLTAWHYRPEAMEDAMVQAHYPLQALLYSVALHRFLRWRHPGYDPDLHLGGSLYLFLRGMSGPGVVCADGSVPGVFAWRPPAALVTSTSDLLAGLA